MKKLLLTIATFLLLPSLAFAQLNTHGGGTGVVDIAAGSIPFGSVFNIRIGTSSAFQFNNSASRLTFTFGSSTALSATNLNLSGSTTIASTINALAGLNLLAITGTQCLHTVNGVVGGTGADCGSGAGGTDPFTHPAAGQSATTSLMLFNGQASSTQESVFNKAYFGATATSTFDSTGNLNLSKFSAIYQDGNFVGYASSTNQSSSFGALAGGDINTNSSATLHNAWFGYQAGQVNAGGENNTGIGTGALIANTTGNDNTGCGYSSLSQNTSGIRNTSCGSQAGFHNSTGSENSYFGYKAGQHVTTGYGNIILGINTSLVNSNFLSSGFNNIGIGYNSDLFPSATGNGQLDIGNLIFGNMPATSTATTFSEPTSGATGISTSSPWATLSVNTYAGLPSFAVGSSTGTEFLINSIGKVGVASTSPFGSLSVGSNNTGTFAISTTTNGCTQFTSGVLWITGSACQNLSIPITVANGGTNSTSFAANSIITSNSAGTGLIATTSALTVSSLLATSTTLTSAVLFQFLVGTSTTNGQAALVVASSTKPQIAYGDGIAGDPLWVMRAIGSMFYISTTTALGTATTTTAAITLNATGAASLSVGSSTPQASATNGMLTLGGGGDPNGNTGSTTIEAAKMQWDIITTTGTRVCYFTTGTNGALASSSGACNP